MGRWNAFKHAASYTVALTGVVLGVWAVVGGGVDAQTASVVTAVLGLNGVTHYIIDRRWTLERFARMMRKGAWIDRDRASAMMHLDQAAHLVILGGAALAIAALA